VTLTRRGRAGDARPRWFFRGFFLQDLIWGKVRARARPYRWDTPTEKDNAQMDWKDTLRHTTQLLTPMRRDQADTAQGFHALHEAALAPGALSTKHKELIALAIGVSKQCNDCIGYHVKGAIRAGATRDEVAEMVNVVVLMNGGPGYMYGAKAMEAFDQLS